MSNSATPPIDLTEPGDAGRAVIGTAGWSIPGPVADMFTAGGTHIQRYARVLRGVEINSSFHRPHRPATYRRWADAVPPDFRFSVKLPKQITHTHRLADVESLLDAFAAETAGLGSKLAIVLVQLPPSFAFDAALADRFFVALRNRMTVAIACEPRHSSWFGVAAEACLLRHRIARVAADPAIVPGGGIPGGWPGLHYYRLHGSPRTYYSSYPPARLDAFAETLRHPAGAPRQTWCIFDNTASGAALPDALALRSRCAG